jgi:DNA-directed RNA polymerase II subunit RPB2
MFICLSSSGNDTYGLQPSDYSKLDEDGFAPPGTRVSGGDIIIGKTTPILWKDENNLPPNLRRTTKRDSSIPLRNSENGFVDAVMLTTNADGVFFFSFFP